ncbi:hypothetical protein SARC_07050 [Sphaeroforma arctica JP610]|uniref:Uncharacterized protein n=1 Tax=Sphaeroforma arctica JP610 TaxID=667725 RepID=A0A0L0FVN2_9EUKA|nr:hypothetical protein SARC_07050 [Sphaeroforma arctica JP610]KNC80596.1 hypothetical protein SARC_07050 [Sphaeroforma arctica JP610]|eukprot:XP_014154498.1 hypothetical protein SARC_07050 [Sphaeroforma arctica JP610]
MEVRHISQSSSIKRSSWKRRGNLTTSSPTDASFKLIFLSDLANPHISTPVRRDRGGDMLVQAADGKTVNESFQLEEAPALPQVMLDPRLTAMLYQNHTPRQPAAVKCWEACNDNYRQGRFCVQATSPLGCCGQHAYRRWDVYSPIMMTARKHHSIG